MQESVKYQYLAAATVSLLVVTCGAGNGWISSSIMILMSNETPLLSGKITMEQASWIASLWCIGGLIGNIIFGFTTTHFGRKKPLIFMAIPKLVCWLLVLFARNVYYLYASRFLYGIVLGGVMTIEPIFLSEISSDRVRGIIGSTTMLSFFFGLLLSFISGNYCDYNTIPIFLIVLLILFAILFAFFPESPSVLLKENKIKETKKSICFYRNIRENEDLTEILQNEINKLCSTIFKTSENDENSFIWSDLLMNPGRKALMIGSVLVILIPFSGCSTVTTYAAKIFKDSKSVLTPNLSAIIFGLILLFGSLVATNLIDRVGRRFLYIISIIGNVVGLTTLGIYIMLLESRKFDMIAYNWIPIASLSLVAFFATWAIINLPTIVISEIMPENIKNFGMSLCMTIKWTFGFVVAKYFPEFVNLLGMHGTMFLFAVILIFGGIFIIVYLPETRGKNHEDIMNSLQSGTYIGKKSQKDYDLMNGMNQAEPYVLM